MLLQIIDTPAVLNSLPAQGYTYLYTVTKQPDSFSAAALAVIQRWTWFGEISPHLFRLGTTYASVDRAAVAATPEPFHPSGNAVSLIRGPLPVVCDGSTTEVAVPVGIAITLEFGVPPPADGMALDVDGRWLPAERTVVINPGASSNGSLRLACAGGTEIALDAGYAQKP